MIKWDGTGHETLTLYFKELGFSLPSSDTELSIHDVSSIRFSESVLNASSYNLSILNHGLKLNFNSYPKAYEEENNKNARDNLVAVRDKVKDWLKSGSVEKVLTKPYCVNPLNLVTKIDNGTGKVKNRPCIDMSRHLNKLMKEEKCKLDDLSVAEQTLEKDDFMCTLDLKNQFFHVHLNPEFRKFFGFKLPRESGEMDYYQFNVMAYGSKPAVNIVTRLLKPVKEFLHILGIKFSIYIDDGRLSAPSEVECLDKFKATLLVLQLAGWNIQWEKTSSVPVQRLTYLGLITDTVEMKYYAPEHKVTLLKSLLEESLEKISSIQVFTARDLASLLGKINSLFKSHGNFVYMCRHVQNLLGKAVFSNGWETSLFLNNLAFTELKFLLDHLDFFNGTVIINAPGSGKLAPFKLIKDAIQSVERDEILNEELLVSDASDHSAFIFSKGNIKLVEDYTFSPLEKNFSSSHRELLGLLKTLETNPKFFLSLTNPTLYWQTDSQNAAKFVLKGSRKPKIQQDILKIKILERKYNIFICPIWTPRTHNNIVLADIGSKLATSTDEFSISIQSLRVLFSNFKLFPTVDAMASDKNFKCSKFYSLIPQKYSDSINFFAQSLNSCEVYYCCPPVKSIIPVIRKVVSSPNVTMILVIPNWPVANFWPYLYPSGKFLPEIKDFLIFTPIFDQNQPSSLFNKKSHSFIAFKIVT